MASGVEFEEDKFSYGRPRPQFSPNQLGGYQISGSEPKMVRFLVRHGWAKTPKSAEGILIALIIINFILTFVIIKYFVL